MVGPPPAAGVTGREPRKKIILYIYNGKSLRSGPFRSTTRNSSGDEIANVNFLYDDIVHVLQNTIDSCIPPKIDAAVMCGTHVYQIQ